jgi:hypothetical protein
MTARIQSLYGFLILYGFTLLSCQTKDSIDIGKVFERAKPSDSMSYYFPPILNDTFVRNPIYRDFAQNWYSSTLYSFKEPILYKKTDSQTLYRLLWLRSFHKPVCFTVKEFNGGYFLSAKTLDRQPSFHLNILHRGRNVDTGEEIVDTIGKPDRFAIIDFDTTKVLTVREWLKIDQFLSKVDFWNSLLEDPDEVSATDGSNWVIEGRKNRKYHFIERRNAQGDLMDFGKYLIKLSGGKLLKEKIY